MPSWDVRWWCCLPSRVAHPLPPVAPAEGSLPPCCLVQGVLQAVLQPVALPCHPWHVAYVLTLHLLHTRKLMIRHHASDKDTGRLQTFFSLFLLLWFLFFFKILSVNLIKYAHVIGQSTVCIWYMSHTVHMICNHKQVNSNGHFVQGYSPSFPFLLCLLWKLDQICPVKAQKDYKYKQWERIVSHPPNCMCMASALYLLMHTFCWDGHLPPVAGIRIYWYTLYSDTQRTLTSSSKIAAYLTSWLYMKVYIYICTCPSAALRCDNSFLLITISSWFKKNLFSTFKDQSNFTL